MVAASKEVAVEEFQVPQIEVIKLDDEWPGVIDNSGTNDIE